MDLVERLKQPFQNQLELEMIDGKSYDPLRLEASIEIENLLKKAKENAEAITSLFMWCEMNKCSPSSSDLIGALKAHRTALKEGE